MSRYLSLFWCLIVTIVDKIVDKYDILCKIKFLWFVFYIQRNLMFDHLLFLQTVFCASSSLKN